MEESSADSDISKEKQILRKKMLDRRMALGAARRLEAAAHIANHFADHPYLTYAKSFSGYYAISGELDVFPIFQRMARFGKITALPRVENGEMAFKRWQQGEPLEADEKGIKAPPSEAETLVPEVILLPLLAFDKQGHRLGYGGGYYDRTLATLRETATPPLAIGVGFCEQEIDLLLHEAHDALLDGVLTPEGVSIFTCNHT